MEKAAIEPYMFEPEVPEARREEASAKEDDRAADKQLSIGRIDGTCALSVW